MPAAPSLTRRLVLILTASLSVVAVILGAGGAWLINGIVERTSDRLLGASARAIAETLAVEDGEITLDLPPFALGMLENNQRDNVYYSVRHQTRLITGYPDLPLAEAHEDDAAFRYAVFRGARIRIASEARSLPRVPGLVVVEVAETLDARQALARRMLLGLALLEAVLVGVAALLVWPAVRWSLRPLTRLRTAMDSRDADFAPLPLDHVPSELASVVAGFNGLLTRLESSVQGIRRFTADASHQMRTPLAILRTHLAVLRKHGLESEAGRASLADIDLATDRLQALLTGLIALARAEEGGGDMELARVDVAAVARQVVTDYVGAAARAGVDLGLDVPEAPVTAPGDATLLTELLANLVDNAIRYCGGGAVELRVAAAPAGAVVEVVDDGPGIPPQDRTRVLERFHRLPRDGATHGSGLGLSIAEAIARRLRARLVLADGPGGRGLAVRVEMNRAA